jgi:predicted XRE-type DNA-binding protein
MARRTPSTVLRAQLRKKIRDRIAQLDLQQSGAAAKLGFTAAQTSRLMDDQDIFTLDRLVDAAARIGVAVRMNATRPYRHT